MVSGLIPARAGNTGADTSPCGVYGAHPRSRGEHRETQNGTPYLTGSSPLARGTPPPLSLSTAQMGLIPARAGNTVACVHGAVHSGAHPRSRGEHAEQIRSLATATGSSPLARGTLFAAIIGTNLTGLIPARAGNTSGTVTVRACKRAHPRSRGEHRGFRDCTITVLGSSPLARGTLRVGGCSRGSSGLIPARAGNTSERAHI